LEFCNDKAYNHQEIPRLNARARRARRDGHAYLKRSTCSTWIMYREHIVLRTVCVQTETSHSLGTQIQYANRFCHRQASACFINALFPVRRCRIMPNRFIIMCPKRRAMWYGTPKSQPHIMPSVSLNSKPTDFFRILKRFLFSFSLSVV
jgi:hypothetical protein